MTQQDTYSADFRAGQVKALSDATRWAVIERLMAGDATAGAIQQALAIDPTLLSHHFRILKQAGFVTSRRVGREVLYALAPDVRLTDDRRGIDLGCCRLDATRQPQTPRKETP